MGKIGLPSVNTGIEFSLPTSYSVYVCSCTIVFNSGTHERGRLKVRRLSQKACLSLPLTCCLLLQVRNLVRSRTHTILSAATFSQSKHTGSPVIHNGGRRGVGGCKRIKNRAARRNGGAKSGQQTQKAREEFL